MLRLTICLVVLAVVHSTAVGQTIRIQNGPRCGSGCIVEGQAITISHVLDGDVGNDELVELGPADGPSLSVGVPELGPEEMRGFIPGRGMVRQRVTIVQRSPLRWRGAPVPGMSGGPVVQNGRAVGLIRARCGPFGCGLRIKGKTVRR